MNKKPDLLMCETTQTYTDSIDSTKRNISMASFISNRKSANGIASISILIILVIMLICYLIWIFVPSANLSSIKISDSWVFKENQKGPIVGDLGGIKVSIPKPFANFVEYQNDPHFLEPRKGEVPKRTLQSKFRSFGFEVKFPDMVPIFKQTIQEKKKTNIYNTMWIRVGIKVDPSYDGEVLQRLVDSFPNKHWGGHKFKRLPDLRYNLVVNQILGYDDTKRDSIPGNGSGDQNIYYHINKYGKIDSYIKCSNIRHDAAPCTQYFLLDSASNAKIQVSYRIGLLPQWQKIQLAVTNLILDFSVDKNTNTTFNNNN
jgi:hypothetical protein